MGITKQYLRWVPGNQFGIIASPAAGVCIIHRWPEMISTDRIAATAACENIAFWDLKTCELVDKISTSEGSGDGVRSFPISTLAYSAETNIIASGHGDGSVRLFDCLTKELKVVFSGHKGFVTSLAFDAPGLRIASAGKDTEIVIWDVTSSAGLFRLKGHKGPVNQVQFMTEHPWVLISASSDTFIKFWDLNTQHCFKTLSGHRSEVWSFVLLKDDTRLISGGSDSELKVWKVIFAEEDEERFQEKAIELKNKRLQQLELLGEDVDAEMAADDADFENEADNFILVERYGTILRKSSEKVSNITVDQSERLLTCHGKDQHIECFKLRTEEEVKQKVKNRLKKERKRRHGADQTAEEEEEVLEETAVTLSDEIEKLESIRASSKVRYVDVKADSHSNGLFKMAVLLVNNALEMHQATLSTLKNKVVFSSELASSIATYGHRSDVRTVAISSDSHAMATASADSVKLWNRSSCRCIATIRDGLEYPLCSAFAPGDKHLVVGTKTGKLQVLSLTSATVQSTVVASESGSAVWSIALLPNLTGIVSGSEDKQLTFWAFDLVTAAVPAEEGAEEGSSSGAGGGGGRQLTLNQENSFQMEDGIIAVRCSPNGKFVAAALLDSTVKIHFADSGKFFLSLYGHKFPVLCMDISSDSHLIVTGSADKNIKIWGMDFGDCHRSLFAHDDNITCLAFIPRTHQFFTCSKDQTIKMWDADAFEKITTLTEGAHHGEIWAMAVAPNGKYLLSASHDKTIRLWTKTNEPLILEEEKELEHERQFEKDFEDELSGAQTVVAGESAAEKTETGLAQKKTSRTIRSVERLMEALDVYAEESAKLKHHEEVMAAYEAMKRQAALKGTGSDQLPPVPVREPVNPHLLVYQTDCPHRFMLEVLTRLKSNEVEETLLELSFTYLTQLLTIAHELLKRRWEVELLCRIVCFILRVNFGQITATPSLVVLIDRLRLQMAQAMAELTDLVGVNGAGLQYYQGVFEGREDVSLFAEMLQESAARRKKKKKKVGRLSAPVLTWT